jgi:hypothetical protein
MALEEKNDLDSQKIKSGDRERKKDKKGKETYIVKKTDY